jgi:hypothetical protein
MASGQTSASNSPALSPEEGEAFEKRKCDDRHIDVELEMALRTGERDRRLVAENPRGDHGQRLGLGRIDLARHDRGTRFVFRQDQFADAAAGPLAVSLMSSAILKRCVRPNVTIAAKTSDLASKA